VSTAVPVIEVRSQAYRTVVHEIAHHSGIDDPRLKGAWLVDGHATASVRQWDGAVPL
jgi:hypothetical protein